MYMYMKSVQNLLQFPPYLIYWSMYNNIILSMDESDILANQDNYVINTLLHVIIN